MKTQAETFEGKLGIEAGNVVLMVGDRTLYPVPYAIQTAISLEAMKSYAVRAYADHIGHTVTIAGHPDDKLIYSARIVRTHTPRTEDVRYSEEYWNNRVPKADVLFTARKMPGYSDHISVDVRQMVTINDSVIRSDLQEHSLMVSDPKRCEEDMYRIYHHSRVKEINPYLYEYDGKTMGCEYFMYPYELRQLHKGDCDDWGIELASYLITAGVPYWRVRCVVGMTYSGGGHLTVYLLSDNLTTWYHLNSTTAWETVELRGQWKLDDFPKAGDPEDTIGIEDVWFSFNNRYSWHAFETHASEGKLRRVPWMKNFKITPRFH